MMVTPSVRLDVGRFVRYTVGYTSKGLNDEM